MEPKLRENIVLTACDVRNLFLGGPSCSLGIVLGTKLMLCCRVAKHPGRQCGMNKLLRGPPACLIAGDAGENPRVCP